MCECHDSDAEHELWLTSEAAYWRRYFGSAVKDAVEAERFYREEGFPDLDSPETQHEIQWRLKR